MYIIVWLCDYLLAICICEASLMNEIRECFWHHKLSFDLRPRLL